MSRQGRKSDDAPVKRLTIDEVFVDLIEGRRAAQARRDVFRLASVGEAPSRLWRWGGRTVAARTKSEARARLKKLDHLRRLPPGESPREACGHLLDLAEAADAMVNGVVDPRDGSIVEVGPTHQFRRREVRS